MTNSKSQTPNPKQIPNTKLKTSNDVWTQFWNLKFGVSLEFGVWSLEVVLRRAC